MKKVEEKKIPFFKAKLSIPQINESVIKRKNIFSTLENYLDLKVIFICSPAGFGKTTVLSQWIEFKNLKKDVIFISLDFYDDKVDNFFSYFIKSFSILLNNTYELNNFRDDYDLNYTLSVILEKLNNLNKDIIIILDNYHYILNEEIHKKLSLFINNSSNKIHFIFSGRNEIPNSFLNFRYKYKILEINAEQLLFTKEEILDFFSQYNFYLNKEDVDIIKNKTNGWPLSLKTIILSIIDINKNDLDSDIKTDKNILQKICLESTCLKHCDNNKIFIPILLSNTENKYLGDFLLKEILINLDSSILDFLLKTSIFDVFNVYLCNKLLDIDNSYKFIEEIQKKQLFIEIFENNNLHEYIQENSNKKNLSIKDENNLSGTMYKYNSFFSTSLLNKLKLENNEMYLLLCEKIARIFKENNSHDEAIKYALLTKNNNFICDILSDLFPLFIKNNELNKILNIIENIPKDVVLSNTKLSIYYAILLAINYKIDYAEYILNKNEKNTNINPELKTLINFLYTLVAFRKNSYIYELEKYINLVIKKIHTLDSNLLVLVYYYLSWITASTYNFKKSFMLSEEGVLESKKTNNIIWLLANKEQSALILLTEGNLKKSKEILNEILDNLQKYNLLEHKYIINILKKLMQISAYQNDVEYFYQYKNKIIELAEKEESVTKKFAYYYSILSCAILMGKLTKVKEILKIIENLPLNIDFKTNNIFFNNYLNDLKTYILILNDELEKIDSDWEINTKKYINSVFIEKIKSVHNMENLYEKSILLVHFYMKKEKFLDAIRLLKNLLDFIGDTFLYKKIEIYILKAIIYNKQNNKINAIKILKKALIISEESNYTSFFIRGGNDIKNLLIDICKDFKNRKINVFNTYAYNVLGHFNKEFGVNLKKTSLKNNLNPLSKKEIEILKLMDSNITNKDIISNLKIALNTFKTHTKSIYKKLSVNNKQDALKKAKDLNFI
ncbi:MAG: LuxR C-terminal-related transcriptional regulator [Cyanobacteriota bacterium]